MARTTYGNRPTNSYRNADARQNMGNTIRPQSQPSRRQAGSYVYGNAAPKLDVQREMEQQPRRALSNTNVTEHIASQESELNNLKVANDEELCRITSSVDMEEVKRVAIGELGMVYPQEGQIITYSSEGRDYVRKVSDGN